MNADIMYKIFHYLGIGLLVVAIVFIYWFMKNVTKNKEKMKFYDVLKQYGLWAGIGGAALLASFIMFEVSFWIPGNTNFMIDHSFKEFNAGRLALSYIFVIIDAIGWFGIVLGFYLFKNFKDESKQIKLITHLTWIISIPVVVVSTILMLEGNAPYISYPLVNNLHIGKQGIELTNNYRQTGHAFDGINIAFYAIGILGGAFVVLAICDKFMFKYYKHHGLLYTCFFIAVPCGIIGARLWYVCIDLFDKGVNSQFYSDPMAIFRIWEGGLAIMGGAVLGIIGGVTVMVVLTYVMKKPIYKDMKLLHVMDIIIPCILVAQAIGRWGNFFNNEVYGFIVPRQAFCFLPSWILNNMMFESHGGAKLDAGEIYLPLFLIESVTNTIGYFVLYFGFGRGFISQVVISFVNLFSKDKENPIIKSKSYHANGTLLGGYLIWYGATRAILEPLRTKADYYKSSLITSYVMMGVGALIVIYFILFDVLYERGYKARKLANMPANMEIPTENVEYIDENVEEQPQQVEVELQNEEGENSDKND